MSDISTQVIQSMFNHLTASYSEDEAREILVQKYPAEKTHIYQMGKLVNGKVEVTVEADAEPQSDASKLATAVKQKTAKQKPVKAAKVAAPKKVSKMDRARELYAAATDKSRSAMIEVFGKELGLSKAAASTYFYTVKS